MFSIFNAGFFPIETKSKAINFYREKDSEKTIAKDYRDLI